MHKVNSFCDAKRTGNAHQVSLVNSFSRYAEGVELSKRISPHIAVEILLNKVAGTAELRFYHNAREVLNCGSGTLAAAYYLLNKIAIPLSQLLALKIITRYGETLLTARPAIKSAESGALLGLKKKLLPPAKIQRVNPGFWQYVLGAVPNALFTVGAGHEYLLAEFASADEIHALQPNMNRLARLTRRALIVTAKSQKSNYVMRYFAPQFGNPEDVATGSVNFILMQYWWKTRRNNWLQGIQLSSGGGSFLGRVNGKFVELYGEAKHIGNQC